MANVKVTVRRVVIPTMKGAEKMIGAYDKLGPENAHLYVREMTDCPGIKKLTKPHAYKVYSQMGPVKEGYKLCHSCYAKDQESKRAKQGKSYPKGTAKLTKAELKALKAMA